MIVSGTGGFCNILHTRCQHKRHEHKEEAFSRDQVFHVHEKYTSFYFKVSISSMCIAIHCKLHLFVSSNFSEVVKPS